MPSRGFQSSVSPILHFGLGSEKQIDSIRIVWPQGRQELIKNIKADQQLVLDEKNALEKYKIPAASRPLFSETASPIQNEQVKNTINDFKRQPLLVSPLSFSGPCIIKGDLNGDKLEDVFAGAGNGTPGKIYLQKTGGKFEAKPQPALEADKASCDADALFFDATGFI